MSNDVAEYYLNGYNEAMRHSDPFGVIQELRTKELLTRYLNRDNMSILDAGGGNGVYSFFLADLNHKVSLLDIAANHIDQAKKINSERETKLHNIYLGDAQTFETTEKYNIIILHGPLYHIIDRAKRINVLHRMKNLLTSDGLILGFAIGRFAGYFYGVRTGQILNAEYNDSVIEECKTGMRKRAPGWHFHKSAELVAEYNEAGLSVTDLKSVTTQIWMLPKIETLIKNLDSIKAILKLAKDAEDYTEISQDLLCVGKKNKRI